MAGLVPFNKRHAMNLSGDGFYDMLDDFFGRGWFPERNLMRDTFKIDVEESESEFTIHAEMPGVQKEEVDLDFSDGRLTISIKREENLDEDKKNYIHRERRFTSMSRSIYLADINADDIKARLDNGILTVNVPKLAKGAGTQKIAIE